MLSHVKKERQHWPGRFHCFCASFPPQLPPGGTIRPRPYHEAPNLGRQPVGPALQSLGAHHDDMGNGDGGGRSGEAPRGCPKGGGGQEPGAATAGRPQRGDQAEPRRAKRSLTEGGGDKKSRGEARSCPEGGGQAKPRRTERSIPEGGGSQEPGGEARGRPQGSGDPQAQSGGQDERGWAARPVIISRGTSKQR
jgi:hypothetical protein